MIPPTDDDARFARERLSSGCGTMERLLRGLLSSHASVAADVHAIRKLGKSLRGGFALFQLEKSSAREIQAIGRLLAGSRDAVSRMSTWRKLEWAGDPATAEAIASLLDLQIHSAARKPPQAAIQWCLGRVETARRKLDELPDASLAERLISGVPKLRKRVAKRCRRLDRQGGENFHDARKALKAYLGAIGFLPEAAAPEEPVMADLAEILGDENDLATLSAWLEEHGFTADFAPDLWKLLEGSRNHLRKESRGIAECLVED